MLLDYCWCHPVITVPHLQHEAPKTAGCAVTTNVVNLPLFIVDDGHAVLGTAEADIGIATAYVSFTFRHCLQRSASCLSEPCACAQGWSHMAAHGLRQKVA